MIQGVKQCLIAGHLYEENDGVCMLSLNGNENICSFFIMYKELFLNSKSN